MELAEALKHSEFTWFGIDRKGRRGGGVGFLVRKNLQAGAIESKTENLLWLVIQERLYLAVVYVNPGDKTGVNADTLQELQQDILRWREKGEVVVMGDFNCRVGELSNSIAVDKSVAEGVEIARHSDDKKSTLQGRNLMARLNAADMVLVNGVAKRAPIMIQVKLL